MLLGLVPTPPGRGGANGGQAEEGFSAGAIGMLVLLVSLSILFAASVFLYIYFRTTDAVLWESAPLPSGLWTSSIVLVVSSITMHMAVLAARNGRKRLLAVAMLTTTALGFVFLTLQAENWSEISPDFETARERYTALVREMRSSAGQIPPDRPQIPKSYAFFYLLTGLHAAHVFGGLVSLTWVSARALRGHYSREYWRGVRRCAEYWHFLDVVWLILFALLMSVR